MINRMGDGPILSVIHTVTTDTMLDNNSMSNGHGLRNVTCKQGMNWIIAFAFAFRLVGVYEASEITMLYWCWRGVLSSDFRTVSVAGDSNLFVDVIL